MVTPYVGQIKIPIGWKPNFSSEYILRITWEMALNGSYLEVFEQLSSRTCLVRILMETESLRYFHVFSVIAEMKLLEIER